MKRILFARWYVAAFRFVSAFRPAVAFRLAAALRPAAIFCVVAVSCFFVFACSDDDYKVSDLNQKIISFINLNYPGAKILEAERKQGAIKVEIFHENKEKEVFFLETDYQWLGSEWDVKESELPAAVKTSIASTQYAYYRIDDIDFVQKPYVEYYDIDMEQLGHKVRLCITPMGFIL